VTVGSAAIAGASASDAVTVIAGGSIAAVGSVAAACSATAGASVTAGGFGGGLQFRGDGLLDHLGLFGNGGSFRDGRFPRPRTVRCRPALPPRVMLQR